MKRTLLHWLAKKNDLNGVKLVLNLRPKIDELDIFGKTPLAYACENLNLEIVKALLTNGANPLKIKNFRSLQKRVRNDVNGVLKCISDTRTVIFFCLMYYSRFG